MWWYSLLLFLAQANIIEDPIYNPFEYYYYDYSLENNFDNSEEYSLETSGLDWDYYIDVECIYYGQNIKLMSNIKRLYTTFSHNYNISYGGKKLSLNKVLCEIHLNVY